MVDIGFDVEVNGDIIFLKVGGRENRPVQFVDRGARWEFAKEVHSRTTSEVTNAIDEMCITILGQKKVLILDCEIGLNDEKAEGYVRPNGIQQMTAAPRHYVRIIHRRATSAKSTI